ncbi:MAG: guanylyltransferase [Clostridia bacterium]|nr:guanylyltransferase [Clostridia bacterium]
MNFDELDKKMRSYEESLDTVILPEQIMVARLDGKNFTRLTKEICQFEAPFDIKFRDIMVNTVKALMQSGFRIIYGYTESDEISLLFHPSENTFGRKVRKFNSILAGVASAAFSMELGTMGIFDCRIAPLPSIEKVADYFLWRQEDAHRNALNAHCYWMLRKEGKDVGYATKYLEGKSTAFKNELLFERGIKFNDLPDWQKRGIGITFGDIEKRGFNPKTGQEVVTTRRGLDVNMELPCRKEYGDYIRTLVEKAYEAYE